MKYVTKYALSFYSILLSLRVISTDHSGHWHRACALPCSRSQAPIHECIGQSLILFRCLCPEVRAVTFEVLQQVFAVERIERHENNILQWTRPPKEWIPDSWVRV
jgi:hypothetical protein